MSPGIRFRARAGTVIMSGQGSVGSLGGKPEDGPGPRGLSGWGGSFIGGVGLVANSPEEAGSVRGSAYGNTPDTPKHSQPDGSLLEPQERARSRTL